MGGITPGHLLFVLIIAVLVIGPGKLPEVGAALGTAMRDFRRAMDTPDQSKATSTDEGNGPPAAA